MPKHNQNLAIFISLFITLSFFIVGLFTINDYGETTDEKFDQNIGEWYYHNWSTLGYTGLVQRFIPLQRNYGPLFDEITVISNDYLSQRYPVFNAVASYHFPVLIISSLAVFVVFWFGYINYGLEAGILGALVLALMPRFIGDSQNNLKDTPLMFLFMVTVIFFYQAITKNKLVYYLLAGLFLGLTYTIKINAVLVLPVIGLWYILNHHPFDFKFHLRVLTQVALSLLIAFATILVVWPYYRTQPLQRFVETYQTFSDHEWNEYILYLGTHYRGHEVPWHYPFVMFGVTMPTGYVCFFVLGLAIALVLIVRRHPSKSYLSLLLLWFLLPPLTQALSPAPMYDGIRHFLISLPPLALLIGFCMTYLLKKFQSSHVLSLGLATLIAGILLYTLAMDVRYHPYEIVYFNYLTGGVKGAYGKFDLDYWGQSLKEAAAWIDTHLPTGSKIMTAIPMDHHFPVDRSRFTLTRDDPDYKVSLIRGMLKSWDPEPDYLHPLTPPIYSVIVDGAPVLNIYSPRSKP